MNFSSHLISNFILLFNFFVQKPTNLTTIGANILNQFCKFVSLGYNSSTSNKASGVVTTTIHSELQQVSHSIKHMTKSVPSEVERPSMAGVSQSGSSPAAFLKQGERRPLCGESSQHSVTKSKTKNEQMECVRQLEVGVLPLGSLTVRLPAVGNGGCFVSRRYQALPLESVPTSSHQPATRKRAHGGGWPKGKSRKIERGVQLPKLAATG